MGYSAATGYAACVVSVVGFGSNLAPAKWVRTADGVFFALNNVFGIFLVGMALVLARGGAAARFEPLAALGGAAWALGNVCVVPIIKLYGLSLGLLVWGTANMLTGWATGRFGLLGTAADPPLASPALNYAGVLSALLSLAAFSRVGSSVSAKEESFAAAAAGRAEARRLSRGSGSRSWNRGSSEVASIEEGGLLPLAPSFSSDSGAAELLAGYGVRAEEEEDDPFAAMPRRRRQALGFALSLLIGLLYGTTFDGAQHLMDAAKDHPGSHSPHALDYVFSHFTGIMASTVCYWLLYCVVMRARGKREKAPPCAPEAVASGVIWGIAQVAWFVANEALSFEITFPIIATLPGLVGAAWGVLVFGEIRGARNYCWLGVSAWLQCGSVALIALSKGSGGQ